MRRTARGHELIEHTADVGLVVWAPSLGELFAEAAVAVVAVMGSPTSRTVTATDVALEAPDLEALLVDWLSEVLFRFEARELVPVGVRVHISEQPWRVDAVIDGVSAKGFQQEGPAVKAVTYHGLEVKQMPAGHEARVYLDV